jgi:hypothetical protein
MRSRRSRQYVAHLGVDRATSQEPGDAVAVEFPPNFGLDLGKNGPDVLLLKRRKHREERLRGGVAHVVHSGHIWSPLSLRSLILEAIGHGRDLARDEGW